LRGGDPGVRLIEPSSAPTGPDETTPPAPFTPVDDEWLVVALPNIFFETLALHSPPIAARAPDPHLRLNEADAARLGAKAGDQVQMDGSRGPVDVPLAIDASLPSGVAALVAPFAARVGFAVPKGARLRKKEAP
jgi:NADH-quinone oxidoreductase subunit G